jgi:predicted nucleotidyltransferase
MVANAQTLLGDKVSVLRQEWSRFRIKRAWLFGSRAAGNARAESDWDFLIEFSKPPDFEVFMGLKTGLEQRLGGRVDLLSLSACKPRLLERIGRDLVDVT